jgi:uncharacterized protein HemX
MSTHEEVEEHVHHARDMYEKSVAATMAIIAALLAVVSVLGQHYNTEQLLKQQMASDQWAYYQAKDIRRYSAQIAQDSLGLVRADPKLLGKYKDDSAKYRKQADEIQEKARELEHERDADGGRARRFHFGEVFLEVAIVLSSLSILTRRKPLFYGALASTLIGVVWAGSALAG